MARSRSEQQVQTSRGEPHHRHQQRQLTGELVPRRQQPDRPVVGGHHPEHVPEHDREHLGHREERRVEREPVVDLQVGGAGNDWIDGGPGDDGAIQGGPGNDVLIDGDGNDWLVKGDEGDDTVFLGPGADKVFTEQGNDTIYVLPDGMVDKIRCDDDGQANGDNDRVVFIGHRDPLDQVDPYGGRCEVVLVTQELPVGWPYGPVAQRSVMQRTAGTDLPR